MGPAWPNFTQSGSRQITRLVQAANQHSARTEPGVILDKMLETPALPSPALSKLGVVSVIVPALTLDDLFHDGRGIRYIL